MSRLTTKIALLCLVQMSSAFANDVEVKLVRDDVWVVGDSDANDIEIRKIYGAVHQFRGLRGTTINGSSDPVVLPIQDDLKIWMLGGDDYVDIRYAYLRGTSHADLMIELGRDNDELYLYSGSIRRNLILSDDGVYRGDDTITVRSLSAHAIDIETQGSADIDVRSNRVSWMAIESGRRGADDISVVNNDANLIDIFTSDTVDVLDFMANDVAGGLLAVDLRDGNDLLYLDDNTLNLTNALFDGGSGTFDFVSGAEVYDWPWWGHIKVVNFEN